MEPTAEGPVTAAGAHVLVLGSANIDSFVYLERLPQPGETVFGVAGRRPGLGGKGANQAIAASLMGAHATFIGMIGADAGGALVRSTLEEYGVDVSGLRTAPEADTGAAHILVDSTAENTVVVVSGANAELSPHEFKTLEIETLIDSAAGAVGLTQGELPPETVEAFAAACAARGIRFVLNLAPVAVLSPETLCMADPLIVNETEALALLGKSDNPDVFGPCEALDAARLLASSVARSAVITLGAQGAVAATATDCWHQPAPKPVQVIDSTGAGDAFVGALAAALARGAELAEAVRYGVAAGSAAVTSHGTVESYHALRDLELDLDSDSMQVHS